MRSRRKWVLFISICIGIACVFGSAVIVRAEGTVRIDANKKYKGMNASFAKGYTPSIKKDTMQLVIPFRTDGAPEGQTLLVGVVFEREENSPFYFKTYQKQVKRSKNGVYLYRCRIRLKKDRVNGQYPLQLYALVKTPQGTVREEFTIYVEISDGRAAFDLYEENAEESTGFDGGEKEETMEASGQKEETIRQPKILLEQNSLQNQEVLAGSSQAWTLKAKNCSADQEIQNMKVTLLADEQDIVFEKNAWYFDRIGAGDTADLSQNITAGKKALEKALPIQFQFDYEDKKGTAYSTTETVYLSIRQMQQASLVHFAVPESFYESDTHSVEFQVQNTGLAVIYNAKVRLEGQGLFAGEVFLGNIEAGTSQDAQMQIFAGTLNMDAQGNVADEHAEKYGDVSGRVVFSYENEQGEVIEQEQAFTTAIRKPQTIDLVIEEEAPETNQWWVTIVILTILTLLLAIALLYFRMKHYQRIGREIYERTKYL
ncbi:MAG: hypothetical protein HFI83_01560 [Eubacterium sp.]|nr:hypothetical protein [Eubacterium sp.]